MTNYVRYAPVTHGLRGIRAAYDIGRLFRTGVRVRWLFLILIVSSSLFANCGNLYRSMGDGQAAHDSIATDLFNGVPEWGHPVNVNGNNHALWKVGVYNPETGRRRTAYFKPRQYGDEDGWGRIPMEYVAYALNRKLGMDYIPPTAYRKWIKVGGAEFGEGAFVYEVPDSSILYDSDERHWGISKAAVQSDHRILSVLLQNKDGHHKNLLRGRHWTDGRHSPVFIDFGASLRAGTNVSMTNYPAFRNSDNVDRVRRQTFDKLKHLHWNDLQKWKEFISEDEMRGILARRDGIVRYFEDLMRHRGYDAVFLEE